MQKFTGLIVIILCVFGGFLWAGGNLAAIWQPAELLIITGAAIGSIIIGNPPHVIKDIRRQFRRILSPRNDEQAYYMELMAVMQVLLELVAAVAEEFRHIEAEREERPGRGQDHRANRLVLLQRLKRPAQLGDDFRIQRVDLAARQKDPGNRLVAFDVHVAHARPPSSGWPPCIRCSRYCRTNRHG